ncbi:hypothetical protein GCM10011490_15600 [Pseudoclavibacter endophyticus]|uniref:Tripartite tricarboxylate transporter TctB family protein n=1 Tax=Pseudoclavibacter endophyticus TaxID=1778590 RepID=A0A6H9WM10_9MICO|nr:tripartite tricarboxylate transporter TctB family protein [Pseudoclavibacter endophyticus]KAB1649058.1 tripartite tricarboxylate transporter TctB family protein [Pseudoclavibacter endophyticus]GGA65830.1 hypothetical protein GCM10011490_15600 [Pseudoclavibacter endophyticus]
MTNGRSPAGARTPRPAARPSPARRLRGRLADVGIALVALAVALVLLIGALNMDVRGQQVPGPQFFPFIVSGLLAVVGVVLLAMQLRRPDEDGADWHRPDISEDMLRDLGANTELIRVDRAAAPAANDDPNTGHPIDWRTVGMTVGAIALFALALEFVGWIIAATAMFWLIAFAFGAKRPLVNLGIALLLASIIQLLFVGALGLSLPAGFVGVLF